MYKLILTTTFTFQSLINFKNNSLSQVCSTILSYKKYQQLQMFNKRSLHGTFLIPNISLQATVLQYPPTCKQLLTRSEIKGSQVTYSTGSVESKKTFTEQRFRLNLQCIWSFMVNCLHQALCHHSSIIGTLQKLPHLLVPGTV